MKKLMLAAAIVCAAVAAQAVQVKWGGLAYALDAATVTDNGSYTVGTSTLFDNSTLNYEIWFYDSSLTEVYHATGEQTLSAFGKGNVTLSDDSLVKSTAYTYTLVLSGTQTDLAARGVSGGYDYSAAAIETTLTGSFTTRSSGTTQFTDTNVESWTVSGIQAVPEPTSAMLLLLGVAGLALKRKRA